MLQVRGLDKERDRVYAFDALLAVQHTAGNGSLTCATLLGNALSILQGRAGSES